MITTAQVKLIFVFFTLHGIQEQMMSMAYTAPGNTMGTSMVSEGNCMK